MEQFPQTRTYKSHVRNLAKGICSADTEVEDEAEPQAPPSIQLRGPSKIVATMSSTATPYILCPTDAPADLLCDFGVAAAEDEEEGDLLSYVTACHPEYPISETGLAACSHVQLDTAGTYIVSFSVSNSNVRSRFCRHACVSLVCGRDR